MILKLDDFAVFVANWDNKADNIRHIQSILNIGYDSMVFLDDNPFERNIVRENLPAICVPELPEDPADYLEFCLQVDLCRRVGPNRRETFKQRIKAIRLLHQHATQCTDPVAMAALWNRKRATELQAWARCTSASGGATAAAPCLA